MKEEQTKMLYELDTQDMLTEICIGRPCGECPLAKIEGRCTTFSRDIILDAYLSLFGSKSDNASFEVTEIEWENLLNEVAEGES